ncbi:hypothetical protein CIPAW_11G051100 [Carya illinoinensis]|uniref:Uncharacterized protein n=1 Tax=Carya illinoinensis TaxID=32201 RepID=A0A8T1P122_CARIL|nr:hypothetical protein CIPAW_11G051100 [Carya illinoinensis]
MEETIGKAWARLMYVYMARTINRVLALIDPIHPSR